MKTRRHSSSAAPKKPLKLDSISIIVFIERTLVGSREVLL
jgi:hypothetical protein